MEWTSSLLSCFMSSSRSESVSASLADCISVIVLARLTTVGNSNTQRSGSPTPNSSLSLDTNCVPSSECPPSSKKLSYTPTPLIPNNSSHISATLSSTSSLALSYPLLTSGLSCLLNSTSSSRPSSPASHSASLSPPRSTSRAFVSIQCLLPSNGYVGNSTLLLLPSPLTLSHSIS